MRVARSVVLAAIVVALSAAAHVVGGSGIPPGLALALVPVVALPAALLTRRRLGVAGVSVLLGAGQVALHKVFEAAHAGTALAVTDAGHPCPPALGIAGATGRAGQPVLPTLSDMSDQPMTAAMTHTSDGSMLLAHVVAGAALVAVVFLGDRLLYAVRRVCRPIPAGAALTLPALRPLPPVARVRRLLGRPGRTSPFLRGPPRLVAA